MRKLMMAVGLAVLVSPLQAQETRFSRQMDRGMRLEVENVNGSITVVQGTGRTAEVVVTKTVKRGNGDMVKAILEEGSGYVRVCTIYLNRDPNRSTCRGTNSNGGRNDGERFEVTMDYEVRLPSGVRIEAESVNGNVDINGVDTPGAAATVNGDIDFDGVGAHSFETVNGQIRARFSSAELQGGLTIETVNGKVELTFPAGVNANIQGEMVNGSVDSDFPITIEGKWGPKEFTGRLGNGGPRISIETVNGSIKLIKS